MRTVGCAILLSLVAAVMVGAKAEEVNLTAVALGLTAPKYPIADAKLTVGGDGSYALAGRGHGFYWGWDRGTFAYTQVPALTEFTFTARLKTDPSGCVNGQWGLGVREGLVGNERTVSIRYDEYTGNSCITWFYRMIPGDASTEFCADGQKYTCFKEGKATDFTSRTGTWLKMRCVNRKYTLFAGLDGVAWTQVGAEQTMILAAPNVYVGLIFSCGNQGSPSSQAAFDNVSLVQNPGTGIAGLKPAPSSPHFHASVDREGALNLHLPTGVRGELHLELHALSGALVAAATTRAGGSSLRLSRWAARALPSCTYYLTVATQDRKAVPVRLPVVVY